MKKLIPALCMLLVAASMLGTSTFAWFSMNTTVTASSMEVKATTNANLYIAKGASVTLASVTGTSVTDLSVSNTSIKPADMSDAAGTVTVREPATFTTDPTVGTSGAGNTWKTLGTLTATQATDESPNDLDNYCAYAFVTIARKQTTATNYKLTASCKVTFSAESNLNKALRCGIIINGSFYESNDANVVSGNATFTFSDITGLSDNTAYSACLVVWFEGEDSDCFANNAVSLSNNTAEWTFTAANAS